MFNIFKRVKNKVNTSKKDYSLSYDNLAIPDMVPGDNTDKPHVTYDSVAVPEVHFKRKK